MELDEPSEVSITGNTKTYARDFWVLFFNWNLVNSHKRKLWFGAISMIILFSDIILTILSGFPCFLPVHSIHWNYELKSTQRLSDFACYSPIVVNQPKRCPFKCPHPLQIPCKINIPDDFWLSDEQEPPKARIQSKVSVLMLQIALFHGQARRFHPKLTFWSVYAGLSARARRRSRRSIGPRPSTAAWTEAWSSSLRLWSARW